MNVKYNVVFGIKKNDVLFVPYPTWRFYVNVNVLSRTKEMMVVSGMNVMKLISDSHMTPIGVNTGKGTTTGFDVEWRY